MQAIAKDIKQWKETTTMFRPETGLKKLYETIAKMPAWRKAGVSKSMQAKLAQETTDQVAAKLATMLNAKIPVRTQLCFELIISQRPAGGPDMGLWQDYYEKCTNYVALKTETAIRNRAPQAAIAFIVLLSLKLQAKEKGYGIP